MGTLKVSGTIDLNQFWPDGSSDADTAKIIVQTGQNAFKFQTNPGAPFRVTRVFEGAKVRGAVAKTPVDKKGRITVRLQGIDAPELHYRPSPIPRGKKPSDAQRARFKAFNKEYRQHLGETATVELSRFLKKTSGGAVACTVTTLVNEPDEVFDTYGRFVGDISVQIGGKNTNINRWLVEEGWAFPAFYSSMTADEIKSFLAASKKGKGKSNRIWKHLKERIGKFDERLIYRGKMAVPDPAKDTGPLIMPKLFRRQCTWTGYKRAGISAKDFPGYLQESRDGCFLTGEFLEQGVHASKPHFLSDFLQPGNRFTRQPQDLVFTEKPSTLLDPTGKKVSRWWKS